jgi:hypothetical protein
VATPKRRGGSIGSHRGHRRPARWRGKVVRGGERTVAVNLGGEAYRQWMEQFE